MNSSPTIRLFTNLLANIFLYYVLRISKKIGALALAFEDYNRRILVLESPPGDTIKQQQKQTKKCAYSVNNTTITSLLRATVSNSNLTI